MWSLSLGFWEVELEERTLHCVPLRSLRDWTSTTKCIGRWEYTAANALSFGEQESNLEAFRNLADLEFGEVSMRASSADHGLGLLCVCCSGARENFCSCEMKRSRH